MSEVVKLRILANEIEKLELMSGWIANNHHLLNDDPRARVEWPNGSALNGYKEISSAVGCVVSEKLYDLITTAIDRQRKKVADLRAELEVVDKPKKLEKHGPVSDRCPNTRDWVDEVPLQ